ncbi:ANTAR domain-containing protein [Streptomyces sp. NPDC058295]|uniref:ANTAR domain-containing protein n=1 Tax=Streptomyces sp. NPDC058295 TaxID=3346431 RepID=UPI0036EEF45E
MTTSREQRTAPRPLRDATVTQLEQENAQLRHAVGSHATVDQAIGILIATRRIGPAAGFEVLREVSQHTNTKLLKVAEAVIGSALGHQPLPDPMSRELDAAARRHARPDDTPDLPA